MDQKTHNLKFRRPSRREIDAVKDCGGNLYGDGWDELRSAIGVELEMMRFVDTVTRDDVTDFELCHRLMEHYGIEPDSV